MKISTKASVSFSVTLELNEQAARALDAMAGYGADKFLEVFYEKLGRHYMRPHEQGLRELLKITKNELPSQLRAIDEARKVLIDEARKVLQGGN